MDEEIAALEQTNMWDLLPFSYMFVRSHISGSTKLRPALIVLLIAIRLVLLFVIFSRNMVMIIVHTLLVIASIQKWSISQLDIKNDFLNSLPCNHRLVILFLGVWFVTFMAWFDKA
jgi:hypothetical protein